MQISTLTQKGQVVIPQPIREALGLKPSTRVFFEVKDDEIIVKPALSIDEAFGMVKTTERATQADYDEAIKREVIKKFSKKLRL